MPVFESYRRSHTCLWHSHSNRSGTGPTEDNHVYLYRHMSDMGEYTASHSAVTE